MKLKAPSIQKEWLEQHIAHRLRASLAGSPFLWQLINQQHASAEEGAKKYDFCRDMAMFEGRQAAVRWLIEFVGVSADSKGNPKESQIRRNRKGKQFDVDIMDLPGGEYFDLNHKDAKLLAEVWLGCSQATSHPTFGSNHPSTARDRVVHATRIVVEHMQRTIYAAAVTTVKI